ncbi:unnamed protein product [Meganyctiphanes norvegica]|uniref:Uncharacterized protein n=1 Tax=Meganyctiphanes norvegica TaxID=48144 RepID=A0AAV2RZ29_MEGNR
MMQVSTMYAQSLERQLVSRRSQLCHMKLARSNSTPADLSNRGGGGNQAPPPPPSPTSPPKPVQQEILKEVPQVHPLPFQEPLTIDPKECTDRLCRLPSQSGSLLGSPRKNNSPAVSAAAAARLQERNTINRLTKSTGDLAPALNNKSIGRITPPTTNTNNNNTLATDKKAKVKLAKEAKKVPSNVMMQSPWVTQVNCFKLIDQVKSGDILEFNIKLHHHWGIALVPKDKKASIDNMELIHLAKDKNGRNRVVRQPMKEYWHSGVTARINNSRDVNKPPLPAGEVTSHANKLIVQPYRVWENSDKLVTFCRYGEGQKARQLSDAARWGSLSRCMGLWMTMTSKPKSANTTPATSPKVNRKRTVSVHF